jgi:CheY-like chemotaxis protein
MMTSVFPRTEKPAPMPLRRNLARLLLADTDPASRVALESLLTAAGYLVDCAATSAEAMSRLDQADYQLVLADLEREAQGSGGRLLAYARQKECRPATALLTSSLSETESAAAEWCVPDGAVCMSNDNVLFLLGRVAELIGERADRRVRQSIQRSGNPRAN